MQERRADITMHAWRASAAQLALHHRAAVFAGGIAAATAVIALLAYKVTSKSTAQQRLRALIAKHTHEDGGRRVVHLYTFPQTMLSPSITPFGVSVEAFLKLTNIEYVKHFTVDATLSPSGRLPFVIVDGECIDDSNHIMRVLSTKYGADLDAGLTQTQIAVAKALRATIQGSILPLLMRSMFVEDVKRGAVPFVATAMGVPRLLQPLVARLMRGMVSRTLHASGLGKLTREQFVRVCIHDLQAVESLLHAHPYLLGDKPTSIDCVLYGTLLAPYRLYFLSSTHGEQRQVRPVTNDMLHNEESTLSRQTSLLATSTSSGIYINEAMQYLVDSVELASFLQRMTQHLFPHLDQTLAPSSPTRTQRDIDVLARQASRLKHQLEFRSGATQGSRHRVST